MTETFHNLRAHDIGMMFGRQSASSAKTAYTEILKEAEIESDLLEIMTMYWQHDKLLVASMFPELDPVVVREGWSNGFLDFVFPLRHYA